jgi:hypothetical protein
MGGLIGVGIAVPSGFVKGAASLSTSSVLTKITASGTIGESLIAQGSITGLLTIAKSGSTARTATFPDRAISVAGTGAATTNGTIAKFDSSGNLTDSLLIDGVGTGALTIAKSGTTARTATFPDAAITVAGSASALTSGRVPYATTGGLLTDSASGVLFNGTEMGIGAAPTVGNGLLQLASGSGKATGIAFGTDVFLYRSSTATITETANFHFLGDGTGQTYQAVVGASGYYREFRFHTGTDAVSGLRWRLAANSTVESGSNAGSDFVFQARDDAGSLVGDALTITRSNLKVSCGSTTDATSTTAAALVLAGGLGVAKKAYFGDTTSATSSTAAAVVLSGGLATANAKDIFCGGRVLEDGCFAEIHVHDASAAQTITTGSTYTKSTAFTDNGPASNCTADASNDKITLTKAGYYRVEGSVSFTTNTNNVTVKAAAFLGGTEQDNAHCERKIGTSSDIGNMSFTGIIDNTTANTDLDLRFAHDYGSDITVTAKYMTLNVSYLGET